jgi:hypothetical protein
MNQYFIDCAMVPNVVGARLSQPLVIAPAPLVFDSRTYQKHESGESRR